MSGRRFVSPHPSSESPATNGALDVSGTSLGSRFRAAAALPTRAPAAREDGPRAADRRRLGLRAEVGRLPRDRVRRRRRRAPAVAQRQAALALLPRAEVPRRPLRARRRDRAVRRRGPPGLRRARPAHPPGEVADRHARGVHADALHRVRPAGRGRRRAARPAPGGAPRAPRADRRGAGRPDADDGGPRRGRTVAAARRGRDRQAPGRALLPRRARRHGQDQARPHDRRRDRRLAAGQGGEHPRLAHPRPLRRRRQDARRRPLVRVQGGREARAARAAGARTRPVSAAWATRAAGTTSASSSGSS